MLLFITHVIPTVQVVAYRSSSHFFLKHRKIIIVKNARYNIIRNVFYEYSHNTITSMINYSLNTTFRIIFGILRDEISKSNVKKSRDTTICLYESR